MNGWFGYGDALAPYQQGQLIWMLKPHLGHQHLRHWDHMADEYVVNTSEHDGLGVLHLPWFTALPVLIHRVYQDGRAYDGTRSYQLELDLERAPVQDLEIDPTGLMRSIYSTRAGWWYSGAWLAPEEMFQP